MVARGQVRKRDMGLEAERGPATVIPFVLRGSPANRLTLRERAEALRWGEATRSHGVRRVAMHDAPGLGDFLLVYEDGRLGASWGIGLVAGSFEVWRQMTMQTVGRFETLREALEAILRVGGMSEA
jgi:hypothetical protein